MSVFSKIFNRHLLSILLISAICLSVSCTDQAERVVIIVGGQQFLVEVVRTREDQAQGLMRRKELGEKAGMIFVYSRDRRLGFWMKDTEIPLSLAFLNAHGDILQIEDMQPFDIRTVLSSRSVRYALELRQGMFDELGVEEGDKIIFPEDFP